MHGADALDGDLGWTLGVVFRSYVRTANAVLGHLPGGPRGYQVLAAAAQESAGGPELAGGQGALAQRLGIDKTVMTYLVDDLERAGLVRRQPDPADRRHKHLVATARGRSAWQRTQTQLEQAEQHLLAPLDPADRVVLRDLLRRLAGRAQSVDPVTDACQLVTELAPAEAPDPARSRRSRA